LNEELNSTDMDETIFYKVAQAAFAQILTVLDDEDPDIVEGDMTAGVLKIHFPQGTPYILNTQRPVREIWLAAGKQAWHFRCVKSEWICPKTGDELFSRLAQLIQERAGAALSFV
jgi:CyaY protein